MYLQSGHTAAAVFALVARESSTSFGTPLVAVQPNERSRRFKNIRAEFVPRDTRGTFNLDGPFHRYSPLVPSRRK